MEGGLTGNQTRTEQQYRNVWACCLEGAHVLVLLLVNQQCVCVKKGFKCGLGCRCKNCGNIDSGTPGTQQQPTLTKIHEVEEEELLHESLLRKVHGDELVEDDDNDLLFFLMSQMHGWRKQSGWSSYTLYM